MKKILMICLIAVAMIVMPACATINSWFSGNTTQEQVLKLAVDAACAAFFTTHPQYIAPTVMVTNLALAAITSGEVVTLDSAATYILNKVDTGVIPAADQPVINDIVTTILNDTQAYLTKQGVSSPASQLVVVQTVLQWINADANAAQGKALKNKSVKTK
jgi:hypothetical protein